MDSMDTQEDVAFGINDALTAITGPIDPKGIVDVLCDTFESYLPSNEIFVWMPTNQFNKELHSCCERPFFQIISSVNQPYPTKVDLYLASGYCLNNVSIDNLCLGVNSNRENLKIILPTLCVMLNKHNRKYASYFVDETIDLGSKYEIMESFLLSKIEEYRANPELKKQFINYHWLMIADIARHPWILA